MAGTELYDFTGVKAISSPWGALTKITNAAGTVIWQKQALHEYQKLTGYVWKKYKLNSTHTLKEGTQFDSNMGTLDGAYKSVQVNSNGIIEGVNGVEGDFAWPNNLPDFNTYPYVHGSITYGEGYEWFHYIGNSGGWGEVEQWIPLYVESSYSRGSYIGEVTATSRDEYPDNSYSGSYWYVYDRISYTTVKSEYKLNEGTQTTLSGMSSQRPSGYPSVWVDENGNITGNGTAYTNTWRSYYSTYKSSYPYIYYNSKWYRIVSATSTSATVVPLTTSK